MDKHGGVNGFRRASIELIELIKSLALYNLPLQGKFAFFFIRSGHSGP